MDTSSALSSLAAVVLAAEDVEVIVAVVVLEAVEEEAVEEEAWEVGAATGSAIPAAPTIDAWFRDSLLPVSKD